MGRTIAMETGLQRSLTDHPVSATAAAIAAEFAAVFDLELPELEVAGITEYLLGLAALSSAEPSDEADHGELLDHLICVAAGRLHQSLSSDGELRRSLARHLDRLAVRLRYGLPVHNPLLEEVAERYPDIHALATELAEPIARHFDAQVTEDEIGYITMYLCGALERTRLRPSKRAIVVCPSGMATVWVLVSRIQTEFPQLELVEVLSYRAYEAMVDHQADLVISTIEIPERDIPVVVVNPLLTAADVRKVAVLA
jgi:mannitol operon transcriptional antiterminator